MHRNYDGYLFGQGYYFPFSKNFFYDNVPAYNGWVNSKQGRSSSSWNQHYQLLNMIPFLRDIANGYNSILEQNKIEKNTGVPYGQYNNPAASYFANGTGQMGQAMSRFARTIDEVYGNPYVADHGNFYVPDPGYNGWSNGYY